VPVAESPTVALRAAFKPNWETDMPLNEGNDPEMSYRRGYQDGALETFHAVERFLDPAVRPSTNGVPESNLRPSVRADAKGISKNVLHYCARSNFSPVRSLGF
jgi:hypothetical protein